MSRSNYAEDIDNWALIKWRGQVVSALRGKRGQSFLRELISALEEMPHKRLIKNNLEFEGEFCALGVVAQKKGLEINKLPLDDVGILADKLNIAYAMTCEIVYENDEVACNETPEIRWARMLAWAKSHLKDIPATA